jgi:glyoxylase-like metal-dependent hydrolase (beta-lactamase superfamily II)
MRRGFGIRAYQRFLWGRAAPAAVGPLEPVIAAGRFRLLPLHTPGHSPDHTVYLEPDQGWLFAGDLFLGERIKFFRADERFAEQIVSIRRVLAHDFDALFCAHNPVAAGGRRKLAAKLAFLEELYGEIRRLRDQGVDPAAIIRRLDPRLDRRVKLITCGNASFANMVRSACLDDGPPAAASPPAAR